MSDELLVVDNVVKKYILGNQEIFAVNSVSFSAERGECIGIMGPSGSGKTTLLSLIGALSRPNSGRILIEKTDITKLSDDQRANLRRDKIGFIFQLFNLIPTLTALENVELPMIAKRIEKKRRKTKALNLLKLVGLEKRANHLPDQLSGGEMQRVAIARALANDPLIVLADEPTGNLDTNTGISIIELLKSLIKARNGLLIVATHDPFVSEKLERIIKIRDGKIIEDKYNIKEES
ncbi:MAG: ABC transporter ATP-binding protein [Candidatus Asgardarchaeia archaeon]